METIKLTAYSHGAGCGCKISPAVLDTILHSNHASPPIAYPNLLVGNDTKDDAAVYDLGDGSCIVSTTDFFMPIVDDPFSFGVIASVNAISDIYAMGGKPIMAIAILGWPINKIPIEVAQQVMEGGRDACLKAGIPLAGGHSIDCPEPIFGLAVTGRVERQYLKQNDKAREGSLLYLTKPLGVGIVTTAQKKGFVGKTHLDTAVKSMMTLNKAGESFGKLPYISAMTDVTGFGLLGHLCEVCEGSGLSARLEFKNVPRFDFLGPYLEKNSVPGGTQRNWESYGHKIQLSDQGHIPLLADPQTSGGLLVCVDEQSAPAFEAHCLELGLSLKPFGKLVQKEERVITVL